MSTDEMGLTLVGILAELRLIRADLAERIGSASSVEIKTSARGSDVCVKSYENSDVHAAGDTALEEYVRVVAELNQKLAGALNGGKA